MTHSLPALSLPTLIALALALAACNPVAYVPALVPTAPPTAGVRAGLGANALGFHGTAEVSASPVAGVAVVARGLYGTTLDGGDGDGALTQQGGDLAVVFARPLTDRVTLDAGGAVGREVVVDPSVSYDASDGTSRAVRTRVRQTSVHAGLLVGDNPPGEGAFRIGPAIRLSSVTAVEDADNGRSGSGLFVEPAVRSTFTKGRVEVQVQGGLSVLTGGNLYDDYTSIPFFGGVTTAIRL